MTLEEKQEALDKLVNSLGACVNEATATKGTMQEIITLLVNGFADVQAQIFLSVAESNPTATLEGKKAFITGCLDAVKEGAEYIANARLNPKEEEACSI